MSLRCRAIIFVPVGRSLLHSNLGCPSLPGESKHVLGILMENRSLAKWISTYATCPDQTRDQPLAHIHLGSLSFSQIIYQGLIGPFP